jgi:MFS family permease
MAAMQMNMIAMPWLAYQISGSAFVLGMVALSRGAPMLIFSFFGGVAADRLNKRTLLISTQFLLSMLGLASALLVHTGVIQVWHLIAVSIVQGTIFPFNMPTRQAIIPDLVGQQRMGNAIALTSMSMNINRVLAPTVAGLLLAWDEAVAFYAVALFYGLSGLTLLGLPRLRADTAPTQAARKGVLSEMLVGIRYVGAQPVLLTLIGMAFVVVLLGMPFQQFLPVFQQEVLHVSESKLGLMYAFVGIGSLIGSLLSAFIAESPRRGLVQMAAGALFGISLVGFALSTDYALTLGLLLVVGLVSQGYMTVNNVLLMQNTDRQLYGRVMSVYMMTWSLMPLSVLPMGALVDAVGAPLTVSVVGGLLVAFFVLLTLVRPSLWRAQRMAASSI